VIWYLDLSQSELTGRQMQLVVSILLSSMFLTRRRNYSILKRNDAEYEPLLGDRNDDTAVDAAESGDTDVADASSVSSADLESGYALRRDPHPPKVRTILGCVQVRTPNSSRFADHIHSRILQKFPFLIEMFYWVITYLFYRTTADLSRVWYGGVENLWDVAQDHGLSILEVEASALGMGNDTNDTRRWVEWRIQQWFLAGVESGNWKGLWLTILNRVYALIHIPGTVGYVFNSEVLG
jgi:hypothetical protein